jgi:hypothetical protein
MLHSPPLTICTVLGAQHHTDIHIQDLHHNTLNFCKLTTPATIPTINLPFPTTFTTQGIVPHFLHHNPSSYTTFLLGLQHRLDNNSLRCGSRNSNSKMEPCPLIYKCTFSFLQNLQKICRYLFCMVSSCSHVESSGP